LPFESTLGQKIFPTHLARRSRDLPTNDKKAAQWRKRFSNQVNEKGNQAAHRLRSLVNAHYSIHCPDHIAVGSLARVAV
jgi:hypothetical protein